jgi:conjugal transfer mating pair stabilization protein TraN
VTLHHNFAPGNDYRCTAVSINGAATINSGCAAYTSPTCTLTKESTVPLYHIAGCGPGFCFDITIAQDTNKATCSAPVAGAVTGNTWTHPTTQVAYPPTFFAVPTYINSVQDVSQCTALAGDAGCSNPVDVCTDPSPTTRTVNGTPVTQSCWAWSRTYQCNRIGSNNDCTALGANPACQYARTECLDDPQVGACTVEERIYTCPIPGATNPPKQYVCGGDIYCVGGDCEAVTREASDEFKDAVVGLESLAQAKREFSDLDFKLFKGNVMGCHKPIFGLVNCCAGKSSGLIGTSAGFAALAGGPAAIGLLATPLLTVFLCSPAEKEYDVRDRMGLCHTVGTYCSSKFLGICTSKRTNACCFLSKLTRILQEQGRAQLGKSWGVPKTPDCSGFTVDEFAALDLSKMDFTEVYKEFVDAAKLPNEAAAMTDIQAKIQAYYARGGPQ